MTTRDDLDRQLDAYLRDGPTELPEPSYSVVRDRTERTRQRVVIGPWRTPNMNKYVPIAVGAAAVVVALVVGSQLLGTPSGVGGGTPSASLSQASASPPTDKAGQVVVTDPDVPVQVTVEVTSSGWSPLPGLSALTKDDDSLDPPDSVGAAFLAWSWPRGTGIDVYGDACHWSTTVPANPAMTPDDIAAALVAQSESGASEPVDVTVDGYAGKALTIDVPMTYHAPGSTREERFAACDQNVLGFYASEEDTEPARNAQGAGQVDELWILDVGGSIVILDATYSPATPEALVQEMRDMVASATFSK